MMNRDDLKDFQNLGANMQAIMGGFGSFTMIASKFLIGEGIGTPDDSMIAQFEPTAWYPLDRILRVFDRIQAEFGNFTLRQVGMHVPKVAPLPPQIVDIVSAFEALDIGYHLNHGKNNEALFNPATGQMKEGIGHYKCVHTKGTNRISIESTGIYPCSFDDGLVTGNAQRFKPMAMVTHDKASCRIRGGSVCTYHITWK
jgi:hypothetical protein